MPRISSTYARLFVLAVLGVLMFAVRPAPAAGTAIQQCETCWNEYFAWNWHHNFPENDGQWDCDTGDGCHGSYYAQDTCDEANHAYPCVVDAPELEALVAFGQGDGDANEVRDLLDGRGGAVELDVARRLLLVPGCVPNSIAASIPLTDTQITDLLGN